MSNISIVDLDSSQVVYWMMMYHHLLFEAMPPIGRVQYPILTMKAMGYDCTLSPFSSGRVIYVMIRSFVLWFVCVPFDYLDRAEEQIYIGVNLGQSFREW